MAVSVEEAFDSLPLEARFELLQRYFHFDPPTTNLDDERDYRYRMLIYPVASELSKYFNPKNRTWCASTFTDDNPVGPKTIQKRKLVPKPAKRKRK